MAAGDLDLPDRFNIRQFPKISVAGHQRRSQIQSGCGDDAVGHIGNDAAVDIRKFVGYLTCEMDKSECHRLLIEGFAKSVEYLNRHAISFDQIGQLDDDDRRNKNGSGRNCLVNRRFGVISKLRSLAKVSYDNIRVYNDVAIQLKLVLRVLSVSTPHLVTGLSHIFLGPLDIKVR